MVWMGEGKFKAALCYVQPEPYKKINSLKDVVFFSLMIRKGDELVISQSFAGKHWQAAVLRLIEMPIQNL